MDRRIAPILTVSAASLWMAGCSFVSVVDPSARATPPGTITVKMTIRDRSAGKARRVEVRQTSDGAHSDGAHSDGVQKKSLWARLFKRSDDEATPVHAPTSVAFSDLTAFGFASITAQSGSDAAQRRLQAARAAKLDAYRNLAEQLYGVDFASDSVIQDSQVRDDQIRVRVSGVIAGAEVVALEPLGNDSYQATVRLPADKVAELQRR
jgi:hypothetical protein